MLNAYAQTELQVELINLTILECKLIIWSEQKMHVSLNKSNHIGM